MKLTQQTLNREILPIISYKWQINWRNKSHLLARPLRDSGVSVSSWYSCSDVYDTSNWTSASLPCLWSATTKVYKGGEVQARELSNPNIKNTVIYIYSTLDIFTMISLGPVYFTCCTEQAHYPYSLIAACQTCHFSWLATFLWCSLLNWVRAAAKISAGEL